MDIGGPELLIVIVVALLLFGPTKIPKLARALGQAQREFRNGMAGLTGDDDTGDDDTGTTAAPKSETPAADEDAGTPAEQRSLPPAPDRDN